MPMEWDQFFQLVIYPKKHSGISNAQSVQPLILGGWTHPNHTKQERLFEQIRLSTKYRNLDYIEMFLRGLPHDQWLFFNEEAKDNALRSENKPEVQHSMNRYKEGYGFLTHIFEKFNHQREVIDFLFRTIGVEISDEEALRALRYHFPESRASETTMATYRSYWRQTGATHDPRVLSECSNNKIRQPWQSLCEDSKVKYLQRLDKRQVMRQRLNEDFLKPEDAPDWNSHINENDVIEALADWLIKERGANILQKATTKERGPDIYAHVPPMGPDQRPDPHREKHIVVEAKGGMSSRGENTVAGVPFSKGQIFDLTAKGLYQCVQRRDESTFTSSVGVYSIEIYFACPDTPNYRYYLRKVIADYKSLGIGLLMVQPDKTVEIVQTSSRQ